MERGGGVDLGSKEEKIEPPQKGSILFRHRFCHLLIGIIKAFEGKWKRKITPFNPQMQC